MNPKELLNEPGKEVLEELFRQVKEQNGVFSIGDAIAKVYGLSDEEVDEMNSATQEFFESIYGEGIVEGAKKLLDEMGIENPRLKDVLATVYLGIFLGEIARLKAELEECKKSNPLTEIKEFAKGRPVLVKHDEFLIAYLPQTPVIDPMLPVRVMLLGMSGGGKE